MKILKNRILDCISQLLQVVILLIAFAIPILLDGATKIQMLFNGENPDFETVQYYYLVKMGNEVIGLVLMLFILFKLIRPSNKEKIMNTGNLYHDHCYAWYWFCSKVLGYCKCSLVRVPVATQFKLIIRDTFSQYDLRLDDDYKLIDIESVTVEGISDDGYTESVNIVLADTYPITKNLMPESTKNLSTIYIQRETNKNDAVRCYSKDFIESVLNTVRHLPNNVHAINLYPATNPKHNYCIANGVFKMANRSNIDRLVIFPQKRKSGNWNFFEKGITIY
ncbi:hypothetical protein JYG23_13095 [Sedimentibacter sp. zth1]|uniref:hypothetical protein n=1 Tax=Sedimentibacter sp. zth1 TaxID=2816908 RepID=UPI001A91A594|nr:hypothetical protein [Sedimentibacter sp. zth1]QSX05594.1 hypothetical protein JYG23_13095 [Sedimentibacter sp. zth1]